MQAKQDMSVENDPKSFLMLPKELVSLIVRFVGFNESFDLLNFLLSYLSISTIEGYPNLIDGITFQLMDQQFSYQTILKQKTLICESQARGIIFSNEFVHETFRNPMLSIDTRLTLCHMQLEDSRVIFTEPEPTESFSMAVRLVRAICEKYCRTKSEVLRHELLQVVDALIPTFPEGDIEDICTVSLKRLANIARRLQAHISAQQPISAEERFHLYLKENFYRHLHEAIQRFRQSNTSLVLATAMPMTDRLEIAATDTTHAPEPYFRVVSMPMFRSMRNRTRPIFQTNTPPECPVLSYEGILAHLRCANSQFFYDAFEQFISRRENEFDRKQIRSILSVSMCSTSNKCAGLFSSMATGISSPDDRAFVSFLSRLFGIILESKPILSPSLASRTLEYILRAYSKNFVKLCPELANQSIELMIALSPLTTSEDTVFHCYNALLNGLHWSDDARVFDSAKSFEYLQQCILRDESKQYIKRLFEMFHFRLPKNSRQYEQQSVQANAFEFLTFLYVNNQYRELDVDRLILTAFKAIQYCGRNPERDVRLKSAARLLFTLTMNSSEEKILFSKYSTQYQEALLLLLTNDHSFIDGVQLYMGLNLKSQGAFQIPQEILFGNPVHIILCVISHIVFQPREHWIDNPIIRELSENPLIQRLIESPLVSALIGDRSPSRSPASIPNRDLVKLSGYSLDRNVLDSESMIALSKNPLVRKLSKDPIVRALVSHPHFSHPVFLNPLAKELFAYIDKMFELTNMAAWSNELQQLARCDFQRTEVDTEEEQEDAFFDLCPLRP